MSTRKTEFLIQELRRVGHNPPRTLAEALRIAQRQAKNLLLLTETYEPPVDPAILEIDPKVELRYTGELRHVSGLCRWVGWRYVIAINKREPLVRQRFTAFHEFKHAIDGAATTAALNRLKRPARSAVTNGRSRRLTRETAEYVADYFAACVLMPENWVSEAVREDTEMRTLARRFGVSTEAMRIRLATLGLDLGLIEARVA